MGVAVEVQRSWLVTLVALTLAFAWSAQALLGELTAARALVLGAAVALALSGSLLVHELAHAVAARRAGVEVESIRLFAGGAATRRRSAIPEARDQFNVAAAGPVTSVALAVLVLALGVTVEVLNLSSALSAALWFVAFANVLVAISNMLPVFPFDGGKVLHALVWNSTGDRDTATARLRRGGREFSRIIVSLGILTIAWAGDLLIGLVIAGFGVWLMFLPAPPSG
jgi:Zn-dependent protease